MDICRCPNISLAVDDPSHPCHGIVKLQNPHDPKFQLPEPWTGDIVKSPLLFVASNPSINRNEAYPNHKWSRDEITDFFTDRFDESKGWTSRRKVLLSDRKHFAERSVSFWNSAFRQAERAFGRNVVPGVDYALTEVVHCKSEGESHVSDCRSTCSDMWMKSILTLSRCEVIVLLGKQAREWFEDSFEAYSGGRVQRNIEVYGKLRTVVTLPHPNERGSKKILTEVLTESELAMVRSSLNHL